MWVSVIEIEYVHLMIESEESRVVSDRYLPSRVPSSGFLIWLRSGEHFHGSYSTERKSFSRSADAREFSLSEVKAWAALPDNAPEL
jgi:hypothetical protein